MPSPSLTPGDPRYNPDLASEDADRRALDKQASIWQAKQDDKYLHKEGRENAQHILLRKRKTLEK